MTQRRRADLLLVERGFFESRARAQAAIAADLVRVDGEIVRKASQSIAVKAIIQAEAAHPYVSRGGVKLRAALDHFGLSAAGLISADIGASTGGFTEVLLQDGAAKVYAVDAGHDQLHESLCRHPKIVLMEETDARLLTRERIPEPLDIIVSDVSFISLRLALPAALALTRPGAALVALVKPQFEAGRKQVGKGGIVKDEAVQAAVCADIAVWLEEQGWGILGIVPSPIAGGDGNREFLIAARRR